MADSPTTPRYPTWMSAARQIWKEGGRKVSYRIEQISHSLVRSDPDSDALFSVSQAVYRGFIPCMLRAFPTVRVRRIAMICAETVNADRPLSS